MTSTIVANVKNVNITNPDKLLWPELGISKLDYINILNDLAPYIIPHAKDRLLTTIRYPDGVSGKSFYQKNIPAYAPEWIKKVKWKNVNYIVLNDYHTLMWLGNQAAIEFHTSFNNYLIEMYPSALVFDLDPSKGQIFSEVIEVALLIYETLKSLDIQSWVKTSGATGLQLYIPTGGKYNYNLARNINKFFAVYFAEKFPKKITIERSVNNRGNKLYFDYLQMWHGKTITTVYSPRATKNATISVPVEWEELKNGLLPENFNLLNIKERLKNKGDLFSPLLDKSYAQSLDSIIKFIN